MPSQNAGSASSADATECVKAVIGTLAESWNRHDMASFAAAFSRDADFVNVVGMHWRGQQEIEAKHATVHRTIFRNSNLEILDINVRFLTEDIALAHVWTQLQGAEALPGRNVPPIRRALMTCVLVKQAQQWMITAAHNTDVVPVTLPES